MKTPDTSSALIPLRSGTPLTRWLVVEMDRPSAKLVRITHVFERDVYVMPVSAPNMARYAQRPYSIRRDVFEKKLRASTWRIGKLRLPQEFLLTAKPDAASTQDDPAAGAKSAIAPLIAAFEIERNLARSSFTARVAQRARELDISPVSLRRMLLRYYYFGGANNCLLPLTPGRTATEATFDPANSQPYGVKRRGRQPIEARTLGPNTFVVTDEDIGDMVDCFEKLVAKGPTTRVAAHSEYLSSMFSKRHPEQYAAYMARKCPLPITLRQYRNILKQFSTLTKDAAKNVDGRSGKPAAGSLRATGPAEVYEIDATGGRVFLVDPRNPRKVLGTPIIYLVIDRWSRFIVSVYVTLRPASWEEIRFALLIAFTSRSRRFKNLGVNVDEQRWPIGRVCARLVMDRGAEMISKAMLDAAVDGLQIEPAVLPPLCPDGKGIIERVNRELKRKMAQRGIKGTYHTRPLDPKAKKAYRRAKAAAVHSLREIYWALIDIVDSHNNSPHTALKARSILRRAGVRPTPTAAYLWGLQNITGIESPPLDDADYQCLLLGVDKATIANGAINYRNRRYLPMNSAAQRQARSTTSRRRAIEIKVDRSDPVELYAPAGGGEWPLWRVDAAGLQELQEITLEEEDSLHDAHHLLIAEAENDAFIEDQQKRNSGRKSRSRPNQRVEAAAAPDTAKRRTRESTSLKQGMLRDKPMPRNAPAKQPLEPATTQAGESWADVEQRERLETIERQRRKRP